MLEACLQHLCQPGSLPSPSPLPQPLTPSIHGNPGPLWEGRDPSPAIPPPAPFLAPSDQSPRRAAPPACCRPPGTAASSSPSAPCRCLGSWHWRSRHRRHSFSSVVLHALYENDSGGARRQSKTGRGQRGRARRTSPSNMQKCPSSPPTKTSIFFSLEGMCSLLKRGPFLLTGPDFPFTRPCEVLLPVI